VWLSNYGAVCLQPAGFGRATIGGLKPDWVSRTEVRSMKDKTLTILAILGWVLLLGLAGYQIVDYLKFRNAGARFTAVDGQALCLRLQALETNPQPCRYLEKHHRNE
jgi:hypothetical protein